MPTGNLAQTITATAQALSTSGPLPSGGLPSEVVAGGLQSFAAVAAVFVGFLLSTLAERRSWKRRQTEQLRERQLDDLIDLANALQSIVDIWDDVEARLADASALETSDVLPAARDATLRGLKKDVDGLLEDWANRLIETQRLRMALDILGFGDHAVTFIDACIMEADSGLASARAIVPGADWSEGRPGLNSMRRALEELIRSGVRGLSA